MYITDYVWETDDNFTYPPEGMLYRECWFVLVLEIILELSFVHGATLRWI